MGVIITVVLAVMAFFVGFFIGYQECFENEILPAYAESLEQMKERETR